MAKKWIATDFGGFDVFEQVDFDPQAPAEGEVTIDIRAAGMNPADYKHVARGSDRSILPISIGYEVAGVIAAIGPDTEIASGDGAVGDEVVAFRVSGGYATAITVAATNVFAKPRTLSFPEAANLLLVGATAAEMLDVTQVTAGDTVVLHGASGSVGLSVLQQARLIGARVIGTASPGRFDTVRKFGGEPVEYGDGLEARLRELAPGGYTVALDAVGTDEAVDVSLALVRDRNRIVTIAAQARAEADGILAIGGGMPSSAAFRDRIRPHLLALAAERKLEVPVARTFALSDAKEAMRVLSEQHPGGKFALLP
jgi:NADPH2:quinone reductase